MKNERWENYYDMYVTKMEQTEKEIAELKITLFSPAKTEPILDTGVSFATGEDYYKFVSGMLKVVNPLFDNFGEEYIFKKAGMSWLYDYHIKTNPYRQFNELISKQHKCFHNIEQVNSFIKMDKYPGNMQRNEMYEGYMSLCNEYPDLYKRDIFPFEINR